MFTNKDKELALNLIKKVFEDEDFAYTFAFTPQEGQHEDLYEDTDNFNFEEPFEGYIEIDDTVYYYHTESGASKVVFLFEGLPFVIKIPYFMNTDIDLCEKEYEIYTKFSEESRELAKFFAAVDLAGSVEVPEVCYKTYGLKTFDVYVMERADMDYGSYRIFYEEKHQKFKGIGFDEYMKRNRSRSFSTEYYFDDYGSYQCFEKMRHKYGEIIDVLYNRLGELEIGDLRDSNIMMFGEDMKLTDYSGFENSWS